MTEEIYLAGGCFWGIEKYIRQIEGVVFTEVGYANGQTKQPTYAEVCTDQTGFAETVHVRYQTELLSLKKLLLLFFKAIDPTSLNQQGEDKGTQYRTGIYYTNEKSQKTVQEFWDEQYQTYAETLALEIGPLKNFYLAEEYHQKYLDKNPDGYCSINLELIKKASHTTGRR